MISLSLTIYHTSDGSKDFSTCLGCYQYRGIPVFPFECVGESISTGWMWMTEVGSVSICYFAVIIYITVSDVTHLICCLVWIFIQFCLCLKYSDGIIKIIFSHSSSHTYYLRTSAVSSVNSGIVT